MSKIFAPNKQLKMTNIAVVRMSKGGSRFEIACYKNKVQEYRTGSESDLDEVLQTTKVFNNVSKGQFASGADLEKCFGTPDEIEVCKIILKKGQLQVSEKERKANFDGAFKEVAVVIADKCVNTETELPFSSTMIESALKKINFAVKPTKNIKQQALDIIKSLSEHIPIKRADMKIKVSLPGKDAKKLKDKFITPVMNIESESYQSVAVFIGLVDPGRYRVLVEQLSEQTKGKAKLEVMSLNMHVEPEEISVEKLEI